MLGVGSWHSAAAAHAADVVLVIENSPGMERWVAGVEVARIEPGSRVAVVAFTDKVKVAQPLTDDREKVARAVRRLGGGRIRIGTQWRAKQHAAVWAALAEACKLLPGGGEVRLLFGSEDFSPVPADVRQCLPKVKLLVAAVRRNGPEDPALRTVQTPPTVRGRNPPVTTDLMPPPEATLRELQAMGAGGVGDRP